MAKLFLQTVCIQPNRLLGGYIMHSTQLQLLNLLQIVHWLVRIITCIVPVLCARCGRGTVAADTNACTHIQAQAYAHDAFAYRQ